MVNHHKEYENGSMPIAVRSLDQVIKQLQSNQVSSPSRQAVGLKTEMVKTKGSVKPGAHNLVVNSPIISSKNSPNKRSGMSSAQGNRHDLSRQSSYAVDSEALAQIFLKNKIDHGHGEDLKLPKKINI